MHIVFVTNEYPTTGIAHGGIGTMVKFLSLAFVQKGHFVSVVGVYNQEDYEQLENGHLNIHRLRSKKGKLSFYRNAKSISEAISKIHITNPIDLIDGPELTYAFIKIPKEIKKVIRMHGGHHFFTEAEKRKKECRKVWMEKKSFSETDHIIAVSDYVGKITSALLGLKKPYTVIHNPIDVEQFHQADQSKTIANRLVFVGTIIEKKGIRQLIEALPIILEVFPEVELIVVGRDANIPGTKMPYRPILEKYITNEVRDHITFTNAIPHHEVINYIESAEVCVYPSHMEALPLAWLEVLCMGKSFIGSVTGPGPEVVKDRETGLLCNPHSPEDIAKKVIWMLKHKKEALRMGENARQDVLRRFELNLIIHRNIKFYKSLLV